MSLTEEQPPTGDGDDDGSPAPEQAKRTRRQLSAAARKRVVLVAAVLLMAASVGGFVYAASATNRTVEILVAATDIAKGDTLSADSFASASANIGTIAHIPWSPDAPAAFAGLVAAQPIPAGGLIVAEMLLDPDAGGTDVEFQIHVPIDTAMVIGEVSDGDSVLLVDPGEEPAGRNPGRPRSVIRPFDLRSFDGSAMVLNVPPEEWLQWRALLAQVGGTLMVLPYSAAADPDEVTARVEAVWHEQWSETAASVINALPKAGELELVVSFDTSLVPTPIFDGDLVLMVDPGAPVSRGDPGRPRSVMQAMTLENYSGGQMQMFLQPEEWANWLALASDLGAPPVLVPIPPGTDVEEMTTRLNAVWDEQWRDALRAASEAADAVIEAEAADAG